MKLGFVVSILVAAIIASSCVNSQSSDQPPLTPSTTPAEEYSFPKGMGPMTTVWQAGPGVNLASAAATAIRAFFESQMIQSDGEERYVFPGYIDALGISYEIATFSKKFKPAGGTRRLLLQAVRTSGNTILGEVCDDQAGLYDSGSVGSPYKPTKPDDPLVGPGGLVYMARPQARRVELRRIGPHNYPPEVDQGSARAPNWNAFEGWQIDQSTFWNPSFDAGPICTDWANTNYPGVVVPEEPGRRMFPNSVPDPEFQPTLPQYPGWTRR